MPLDFPLRPVPGHPNNLWGAEVTIPVRAGTAFGRAGTYLYRYQLLKGGAVVTRWCTDPFARATDDVGELSAFATPGGDPAFAWTDDAWKVPELRDLVVYELHVEEFNDTFDGVAARLPYLASLGVTCLELLPVTSLKLDFDWGYGPLHYFAPNARWGGGRGLQRLVDACHRHGVAVVLDVVYQHVDPSFPYHLLYADAGIPSPMIGGDGPFGPVIDYNLEFARDYVQAANRRWLGEYHVDGFRYDEVTDLYDGPTGVAYAKMAYDAYDASLALPRFTPSGGRAAGEYSRIIQCPEALGKAREVLANTYSNTAWQDDLLVKAEAMAACACVDPDVARVLDASSSGYPLTKAVHDIARNPVAMPVAPYQYVESHDHSQLIAFVGNQLQGRTLADVPLADRRRSFKLQPFAIALYTCQGVPMLWQGQEFADDYVLPDAGDARIHYRRNVHWEYFYDDQGAPLVRLYRILGALRHRYPALRSRESFYYDADSRPADGVVVYRRQSTPARQIAVVFLNFSDRRQSVAVPFPEAGAYRELVDQDVPDRAPDVVADRADQRRTVDIPSNYGYIFVK
jgi:maltooligosyltrehalose trehalohydrolase